MAYGGFENARKAINLVGMATIGRAEFQTG